MNYNNVNTDLSVYANICRYCLEHKVTKSEKFDSADEQKLEQLLTDTFNIQVTHFSFIDHKICNACTNKLEDGVAFKQQVLRAEKTLVAHHETLVCQSPKQELDGHDTCTNEDNLATEDQGNISSTYMSESPKQEWESDLDSYTSKENVTNTEENISEATVATVAHRYDKVPQIKFKQIDKIIAQQLKRKLGKKIVNNKKTNDSSQKKGKQEQNGNDTEKLKSEPKKADKNLVELRRNTFQLVLNSNMCLMRPRKSKYGCFSCSESFLDIKELKRHSATHKDDFNWTPVTRSLGLNYIFCDISSLSCKKCSKPCEDLDNLREHLQSDHNATFPSIEHLLVPYKLEEGLQCLKCRANFKTFTRLSIHMNSHSTRNICEVCGAPHINRTNMRQHIKTTHMQKVCMICKAVLPNSHAKARHMRMVHKQGGYKRYCLRCESTFLYENQLTKHMIEAHGVKAEEYICDRCDRKFETNSGLKIHIRSIHLGERNHSCNECGKRFIKAYDRNRHEQTHLNGIFVECDFCEVKLKSKDSMRRHLRTVHGKNKT